MAWQGQCCQGCGNAESVNAPRFLIDENLSPRLVEEARSRGFEAMHVNHLGLRTETDWAILDVVATQDSVLVTNNAIEFRGRFRRIDLHPGVVFIVPAVRGEQQARLFATVLEHLLPTPDLMNRAIDVDYAANGGITVTVYDLP